MHIDFAALTFWAVALFRWLQQILGFGKGALETAKTATAIFNDTKALIESPEKDKKEKGIEQARIVAELLRSYALFGLLEYLYRTTIVLLYLLILREAHRMMQEAFRKK